MSEKTSSPCNEYADDDQSKESSSYSPHNRLKVALLITSSHKGCSLAYETLPSGLSDQNETFPAFDTCSEVNLRETFIRCTIISCLTVMLTVSPANLSTAKLSPVIAL